MMTVQVQNDEVEGIVRTMLRPKWIGALALAMAMAFGFVALSHWQIDRSIATGVVVERDTETPRPLFTVLKPRTAMTADALDRMVTVEGRYDQSRTAVIADRMHDGRRGYWAVAQFDANPAAGSESRASTVVALGWAPTSASARRALRDLTAAKEGSDATVTVLGRLAPNESPVVPDAKTQHDGPTTLAVSELVNLWNEPPEAKLIDGFVIVQPAPQGLETIDAPKPASSTEVNWLNVFYAAEWIIFAGFALFLWWRLVADDVRRRREAAALDHEGLPESGDEVSSSETRID